MKTWSGCLVFAALAALPALPADAPHEMTSRRATGDAAAWRDFTSPFWRGEPDAVMESDSHGRPVPHHRTEVRSRWTRDHLYFFFTCPYEELHLKPEPKTGSETNQLWNWDVAEVFAGADFQNIRRYREFEMSPQGEWVDLDIDLDKPRHEDGWLWNSGFEVAAKIDAVRKIWYGTMRIPYTSIDPRPAAAGNTLRINLYRSQGAAHQGIAWQPTGKNTFHAPEAFGTLRLVE
jgi:hypothetical protein